MGEEIFTLEKLSYKIGTKYLLKDIDWQVKQGEHWVVFGMNGSGKTTLLTILAGFRTFTHGALNVFGEEYSAEHILDFRKRIGLVSGSFFDQYYSRETALDIVLSGKFGTFGVRYDISDEDIIFAKRLLSELHLKEKVNSLFHMMSRGERQNVLIARALFAKPEILILDEPCTGLDVVARAHLLETVDDLARNTDMTIIYVSHYTEEILPVFDQCMLLRNGYCYAQGETSALFHAEQLSDFLQHPVAVVVDDAGKIHVELNAETKVRSLLEGRA